MPESFRNRNHQRVSTSPEWATASSQVFSLSLKQDYFTFPDCEYSCLSLLLTTRDSLRAARNEGRWPYFSQAITFSSNIKEHVLTEGPAVSIKNSSHNFTGYPNFWGEHKWNFFKFWIIMRPAKFKSVYENTKKHSHIDSKYKKFWVWKDNVLFLCGIWRLLRLVWIIWPGRNLKLIVVKLHRIPDWSTLKTVYNSRCNKKNAFNFHNIF